MPASRSHIEAPCSVYVGLEATRTFCNTANILDIVEYFDEIQYIQEILGSHEEKDLMRCRYLPNYTASHPEKQSICI
jgi:hypothetical protein